MLERGERPLDSIEQPLDTLTQVVIRSTAWWSGCIAALQLAGAVFEWRRDENVLLGLDLGSGLASLAALVVCISSLPIAAKRTLAIVLIGLTVLMEVETAFHDPDLKHSDSRQYIILVVTMLFLAFVFPGRRWAFQLSCATFVGFYLLRASLAPGGIPANRDGGVFAFQLAFSAIVCSGIQAWSYRLRMTNIVQARELRIAQIDLGRQMMMRDIHDHLGARLADLANLIARLRDDRTDKMVARLEAAAAQASTAFRRGLFAERDRRLLEEEFGCAVRSILLTRYEEAGRQILVRLEDEMTESLLSQLSRRLQSDLLAILLELTTNDLKYGCGQSILQIGTRADHLQFRFFATTRNPVSTGIGSESLRWRVTRHSGSIRARFRRGRMLFRGALLIETGS